MTWDLTGKTVTGLYLGAYPVRGRVESSRVKYGGSVQYTVVLDTPLQVFGAVRESVLMDHRDVEVAEDMVKSSFAILDGSLIDQIANMDGAEVDPDTGTVETLNENTAQRLAAFAEANPSRLTGTEFGLKEQGVAAV